MVALGSFLVSERHGKAHKVHVRGDPMASIPITLCGRLLHEYVEMTYEEWYGLERCKRCLPDVSGFAARNEYA